MRLVDILENETAQPLTLYHITNDPKFKLNADFAPQDNSIAIYDRSGHSGIYLARSVEYWVNGKGYIRPFVAEITVDPTALEHDTVSRWGGEVFIPASQFDRIKVNRVIPLDAHCREEFGAYGWIEGSHGYAFDTGEKIDWNSANHYPFRGWRFPGDTRTMSPEDIHTLIQRFKAGYRQRAKEYDLEDKEYRLGDK